jgi:hypothetical protein
MVGIDKRLWSEVHYHPRKANVVADALSRNFHCNCLTVESYSETLCEDLRKLWLEIMYQGNLNAISTESNLYDRIVLAQFNDEGIQLIKQKLGEEDPKYSCFRKDWKDVVWFEQRLVVLVDPELRKQIFDEIFQNSLFTLGAPKCIKIWGKTFGGQTHYVKTSNRSRNICNGPLTPVTSTHICNGCCLAPVTYKSAKMTRGLASTTPVTNVDFW